jgi:thiazole synthase
MLKVIINGEDKRVSPGSVADMVRALGFQPAKLAVERNREIVPRSMLGEVMVADGDMFEIVHFVGGG